MFLLAATSPATIVAVVSAAAAVGAVLVHLYGARRTNANAARDEALALAETRGQIIADLERRLALLERRHRESSAAAAKRIHELEVVVAKANSDAREQAYQLQRFYAAALADLLIGVQEDLEAVPPNVDRALTRIRGLLAQEHPAV
jgi:ABC-type sugar transport system substrate-binding protein